MAKKLKRAYKSRPLVSGLLERISSQTFDRYQKDLTDLVDGQHGVYALYKRDRLYYVGLAKNLRNRVKNHLDDRHAGKWDRFSLFLIRKPDHIKELESLIQHIAHPDGNRVAGRLMHADDLIGKLDAKIARTQAEERKLLLGKQCKGSARTTRRRRRKVCSSLRPAAPPLALYVKKRFMIHATYKNQEYKAKVYGGGRIRFNGTLYDSPTAAAHEITGGHVNGWWFWKYRTSDGTWVRLRELKRKASRQ